LTLGSITRIVKCNIYIGATSNLIKKIYQHKQDFVDGFTKKYAVKTLVYYKQFESIEEAIKREKMLKTWKRQWKIDLINFLNPKWLDLYESVIT
jgi:putative endonuclease